MLKVIVELQVLDFNIVCGVWDEVKQVKLYSHLACAQKRQKCKFVPRLLSLVVDDFRLWNVIISFQMFTDGL